MGSSSTDHGAPAQVIYHESRIMREWRTEQGLENLRFASRYPPEIASAIFGARIGSERQPEIPVGTVFGPTHTRRRAAIARIRANSEGLPVKQVHRVTKPPVTVSPLDTDVRCAVTEIFTRTCAHCQGHTLDEE